jgi:hypothetical protein
MKKVLKVLATFLLGHKVPISQVEDSSPTALSSAIFKWEHFRGRVLFVQKEKIIDL